MNILKNLWGHIKNFAILTIACLIGIDDDSDDVME